MKTLTLKNRTNAILVINLPHALVPECASHSVVGTRSHDKASGERRIEAHRKRISGSITLLAEGSVEGLPLSVRRAPDVVRLSSGPSPAVEVIEFDSQAPSAKAGDSKPPSDAKLASKSQLPKGKE